MQLTAEIRWFWPNNPPAGLFDWYCDSQIHGLPAAAELPRTDKYLCDESQPELGIKRRGGTASETLELKGLVAVLPGAMLSEPFTGELELWAKWVLKSLQPSSTRVVEIRKQRWLRRFDTSVKQPVEVLLTTDGKPPMHLSPPSGCNIELTRIQLEDADTWWSMSFESFGTIASLEQDLRNVVAIMADRHPPTFTHPYSASYPAWLNLHATRQKSV